DRIVRCHRPLVLFGPGAAVDERVPTSLGRMMSPDLTILYRGPLSSCNYDCHYCPFAKRHETAQELAKDRIALRRFLDWANTFAGSQLSVFFTPWREALTRRWYREGICELSHLPHVKKVAVQTNLSCPLEWLGKCDVNRLGFWCTYHPSQVSRRDFLSQCQELRRLGVRHSVGMVGLREDMDEIEAVRHELPDSTYLWINAIKREVGYYTELEIQRLESMDPQFRWNTQYHASLGRACRCGDTVISVDGKGTIRRCHFLSEPIGNLYDTGWQECLQPRPCTTRTCGCHIGYVHMPDLELYEVYGEGILERIPQQYSEQRP
ncbi:MAG: STM4011 family radical SAM protein, partial [Planctomycetaceae bacterium]|nr:STM4011 family radical SAM protein [Planctomycetaceae bacterium]